MLKGHREPPFTRPHLRASPPQDEADGFYHETWARLPESLGPSWAFRLSATEEQSRVAVLVATGDCFMFCAAAPPGGSKATYEASYGRIGGGAQPWEIQHSTQPGRVGVPLFPTTVCPTPDAIEAAAAANGGRLALGAALTSWVPVRAFPAAPLEVINLGALGGASNAAEVAKLKALLAGNVNAFTVRTDAYVEPSLVERAYAHAKAFHALPTAVKQQLHFSLHTDGRGWIPLHGEGAYEDGPVASHVTTFDMGRDLAAGHPAVAAGLSGCAPNVYPGEEHIPGFRADMLRLDAGLAAAARAMFTGLAAALSLDATVFDSLFVEGTSLGKLRLMSYPGALASPALASARNHGVSAHTDFESFTFLHQDSPGLQLQTYCSAWGGAGRGEAQWYEAPVPDASHFTLICSDMLEILSNGAVKATKHRVAYVPWPRTSLIRFVGFESAAVVAPLPGTPGQPAYKPVTQAAHLDAKVDEAEARRRRSAAAGVIPLPVGPPTRSMP